MGTFGDPSPLNKLAPYDLGGRGGGGGGGVSLPVFQGNQ